MNTSFSPYFQPYNTAADSYLLGVVSRKSLSLSQATIQTIAQELDKHISPWANGHEYDLKIAGSAAKGTGIVGSTDIDYFISLNPSVSTCNSLEYVYRSLKKRFDLAGYTPREQNVSIGIGHGKFKVDLTAGVMQTINSSDHSLWKRKAQSWTKTNIDHHIRHVAGSGRTFDIRAIKIWRELRYLEFPSFYLELSVIEALMGKPTSQSVSRNFVTVMEYLASDFVDTTIYDPANQANEVSDELNQNEKNMIKNAAAQTLKGNWSQAIW